MGAPTILSQLPGACVLSHAEPSITSQATLLPCGPQTHTAPLAPRHWDVHEEQLPAPHQHQLDEPQSQARESLGRTGFPRPYHPVPSPAGLALTASRAGQPLLTHVGSSPIPKASPQSSCSPWLRQAPGNYPFPSQLLHLPSDHRGPRPTLSIPSGPILPPQTRHHPISSEPQKAGQEISPSAVTSFLPLPRTPVLAWYSQHSRCQRGSGPRQAEPPLLIRLSAHQEARAQEDSSLPG